jgi:chaperonin cofactor prefoldin
MNQMPKIKRKIWGFNTREVDRHIKEMQNTLKEKLECLTNEIETCQREKDLLEHEFSTMTDLNTSFTSRILLELAKKRVESVIEYIDQTAKEDVLAIQKSSQQKLDALEDTLKVIDNEMSEAKENIEFELKNIINLAIGQDQANSTDYGDKEASNYKSIGNVYPIADWLKTNKSEQPNKENEFWGEHVESQPQESVEQMTADGITEVPLYKPEKLEKKLVGNSKKQQKIGNGASEAGETENFVVPGTIQDGSHENEANYFTESPSDFWDSGFDSEEEPAQSSLELAVAVDMEPKDLESDFLEKEGSGEVDKPEDFFQTEGDSAAEAFSNPVGNIDLGEENIESEPLPSQAVVRQEISTARHKYVLGKIAGEDLIDNSGRVIIKKGDIITESVFDIAQKEGKIADLIIQMILPGQEE